MCFTKLKGLFKKSSSDKRRNPGVEENPTAPLDPHPIDRNKSHVISEPPTQKRVAIDPWSEAEKRLRQDAVLNKLWEESIRILKEDFTLEENELHSFLDLMAVRLDSKKWAISNNVKQTDACLTITREKMTKVCRNILVFKDIISPAAASSPPAAIACAGVTVGLLLFIQAMEQHDTLLKGLEITSSLIPRLHIIEIHFLGCDSNLSADLTRTLENDLVLLCSKVLEFQSRAICYLQKRSAVQFLTDMFKKDAWDEILKDIERYENTIRNTTSSVHDIGADKKLEEIEDALKRVQVWQMTSVQDGKKTNLFRSLYTCPYKDRKDRNNKRVLGTCEWFTSHPQFTRWNRSTNSELLWVSADPGCGKSVLSRYLADEYLPSGRRTVCYFFFKDDYLDQKRATYAISSILRQLFLAQPHLLHDSVLDQSEAAGEKLVESFNDLWSMFVRVTADRNAGEVVCLLDGLDECDGDDRKNLIQAVESLYLGNLKNHKVKFLMTSRPYDHISREFYMLEKNLPTIHLSGENEENIEMISSEIRLVIQARVKEIGNRNSLLPDECDFISSQLTSVPNRTYLWVTLTMDVVERMPGFSRGNIRRIIYDIPKDIDAAYSRILDRSPDHTKARKLLHIVTAAERPLTLGEISVALTLDSERQSIDDIQDEVQTDDDRIQKLIRNLCGLFLVVIDGKVYLFHQTAKEFLVKTRPSPACNNAETSKWKHSLQPEKSHYILAEVCTLYLSQNLIYDLFPCFMHYSSANWMKHFQEASVPSEDILANRARIVCNPRSVLYNDWTDIFKHVHKVQDSGRLLFVAAFRPVPRLLFEAEKASTNPLGSNYGSTPLPLASMNGYMDVVKLLLEDREIDVNSKDSKDGQTPLAWAAENGHHEVVKLLLETGKADVDSRGSITGQTPISIAAENGHDRVVKLLIESGKANIDSRSPHGRTPLSLAAEMGHVEVVKLLLETGKVDVNSGDPVYNRTPVSWAAQYGRDGVVKLLLETRKVEIDYKNSDS
ncbi:hypothetical protein H101_04035 [Trichophyton interdigitale H6]|nr:hypothetical protein H101_04035 [Trichophyton interdigitale H6]